MKEKRLKDGKRDRRWSARVGVAGGTEEVVMSRIQAESKEGRYVIRRGETAFVIFDPEECLHVGRHDGQTGIVYRFKRLVWRGDPHDYSPSGERGLVPWDGGGWQSLARTVAEFAVARTGQKVPEEVLEAMAKPGAWGEARVLGGHGRPAQAGHGARAHPGGYGLLRARSWGQVPLEPLAQLQL